jgi:energy-coupling factor transporter ATP-binding protein EcfA2
LKSGEVREKIDIFVSNDGVTLEAFLAKSGGERGRVTLAGILAIQHLINLSSGGRGLNLLLLDEVFPGIDSLGQENIINILDHVDFPVMLISQNINDDLNTRHKITVEKRQDVSTIINN